MTHVKGPRPHRHVLVLLLVGLLVGTGGCDVEGMEDVETILQEEYQSITLNVKTWAYIGWDEVALTDAQVTVVASSYAHGLRLDRKTLKATTDLRGDCSIFVSLRTGLEDLEYNPYYQEDGPTFISMTVSATWDNGVTDTFTGSHDLSFDPPYPERWTLWMYLDQG